MRRIGAVAVALVVLGLGAAGTTPSPSRASGESVGRHFFQTRGIWTYFEDRGARFGWHAGQLLHEIARPSVQAEVTAQLKQMRAIGANTITYEIRSGEADFGTPWPNCQLSTALGPKWPQPTAVELAGLSTLFDLVRRRGMRIMLIVNNTHMDAAWAENERWLGAILRQVKDKPALDLIAFGGDKHGIDNLPPYDGVPDSCGGQSEAPLWMGPDSVAGRYVDSALRYGRSLGIPARKLTAEVIVGDYRHEAQQPAGPDAQAAHLWRPVEVLRTLFDRMGTPPGERTYALSIYQHRKCAYVDVRFVPCTDADPHTWADETLQTTRARTEPEARLTAIEFGASDVPSEQAVESLGPLMRQHGVDGGTFWKWTDETGEPQFVASTATVKLRGSGFNRVQKELVDLYGFHVAEIPNGSFENGAARWTIKGAGQPLAADEASPIRGRGFIRLTANPTASVTSERARVSPATTYTTTANLRFAWAGGRAGPPATRPQVNITFHYLTCAGRSSRFVKQTILRFFGAPGAPGWGTFPLRYTTPKDACFVRIEIGAARNRLATPIVLDVDAVR